MHIEHAKLGEDGRLVLPATIGRELGLRPGDTVVIESDGDSLRLCSYERVLWEVQESISSCPIPRTSIADELIVERRAETGAEDVATSSALSTE